jgi:SAM-dependent methyltransferase
MPAQTLLTWEQAEIVRSSNEASRVASDIRPTSPGIFRRYAAPGLDTPYPLEYMYALVGDVSGRRVLDLGCGTGADSVLLAARGADVSAVDISPELLTLASQRAALDGQAERIVTLCGSTHDIPVPDASIDLVFGNAVLHHVDLALTAREVRRVLKPGGRAIFKEPMRDSKALAFLRGLIPYRQPDVSPFERPLRLDEVRAFASGFTRWRTREFELPFVALGRLLRLSRRVQFFLQHADAALLRQLPFLRRFATVSVFEVVR